MPQATVSFRIDSELKNSMESACREMGLSMTAAFTVFAVKVARERRIPFDICCDTAERFNEETIQAMEDVTAGRGLSKPYDTVEELMAALNA